METNQVKQIKNLVSTYNVLFVEDNKQTQEQITFMFKQLFNEVDSAFNGKEGLDKYIKFEKTHGKFYDIVISDINMPVMNGLNLAKRIKELNSTQHILVLSAHNESHTLEELIQIGITTYVHKPIDFNKLMDSIYKIVDLKKTEVEATQELDNTVKLNNELNALMNGYDSLVIASRTDTSGIITYVSDAFSKISGYEKDELIGKRHSVVRHPDMPSSLYKTMWKTITDGNIWTGKIKNRRRDGSFYWLKTTIGPYYHKNGTLLGYNSVRQDITSDIESAELHKKVNLLLDNSKEGYLLIDKEKKVSDGYSKKCLDIFEKDDIKNLDIISLLFFQDQKKKDLFEKGIEYIFNTEDEDKINNFLDLLPHDIELNNKTISIAYKYINSNSVMLILDDISETINLKSELEKQQIQQKMIVNIIANINDFLDIDENYQKLIFNLYKNTENTIHLPIKTNDLLRELHTYKGIFYQMNMIHSPMAIHELETKIAKMINENKTTAPLSSTEDISYLYEKDKQIIDSFLGKEYLKEQKKIIEKSKSLANLKYKLEDVIKKPENINFKIQNIISQIDQMSYDSLVEIFERHKALVVDLGEDLKKPMKPLKIDRKQDIKVPPTLKAVLRNVVHIYKNCIDHGIEDSDLRLKRGKDLKGEIICNFRYEHGFIFIEISDDGNGIDIEALKRKVLSQKIATEDELEEFSESKILNYIFLEQLSTKEELSNISGRGIGMSSIKKSLEEINGSIKIQNYPQEGLRFSIKIPIKKMLDNYEPELFYNEIINIIDIVNTQVKHFLTNEADIDIVNSRYVNNVDYKDKIFISIDINSGIKLTFILFFHKELLKKLSSIFFIDIEEYKEEEMDDILCDIGKEVVNTIIGLSIQDFPNRYKEGILSTPYILNKSQIKEKLQEEDSRIISNVVTTSLGNLILNLILKG